MSLQLVQVGDVQLCFETFGDEGDEPLLLIGGLGAPMFTWSDQFCALLAAEGFWVIRFDNRDSGKSQAFVGTPDLAAISAGDYATVAYDLSAMAADADALLRSLQVRSAHLVGMSMGGMIAQLVALDIPRRVRSLTCIMSTTGAPDVGATRPDVFEIMMSSPSGNDEAAAVQHAITWNRLKGSPRYPLTDEQIALDARRRRAHGSPKGGALRHGAAVWSADDRTAALRQLRIPVLVLHGESDPVVDVSGGRAIAEAVPGAWLMTFAGMAHDLPEKLWPDFVASIAANARRVVD